MENFQVYRDIQARTGGDIYIGVVGPVRTGKSTFIRRFMELIALPSISEGKRAELQDELPLSGAGKQFASNGKYTGKSKKANAELIKMTDSVLRSQKISASLTTTAQKKTALQKLFNYSKKYGYMRMKGFDGKPLQFTKGKSQMFAYLTMGMEKGNCYGVASAFAVQAKRATGLPVRVCWGKSNVFNKNKWQPHGWTEIKIGNTWYTFDANAAGNKSRKDVKYYMQKSSSMKKYYKTEGREDIVL